MSVDTGVFSASLRRKPHPTLTPLAARMVGQQVGLAPQTVAELRYGALVAGWGHGRRQRLESAIAATTVIPMSDKLMTVVAELRYACRRVGHPLANRAHTNDLWIAACAIDSNAPLLTADGIFQDVPGLAHLRTTT
ncbi:MAG: PIN domain-containing protein [Euzebya sp.]